MRKNAALLGATGAMGQRFVKMLEKHPFFDLRLLIASEQRKGKKYGKEVRWLLGSDVPEYVKDMEIHDFKLTNFEREGIDIVFSALPADIAREYEGKLREHGYTVFSNSSAYRMERDVPILIPEINAEHIELVKLQKERYGGYIVTNSNCSTSGLALALAPLRNYGIERVFVTTYQAVSGAGYPGVASLDICGNIVPYIKREEEKMRRETRKILGKLEKDEVRDYPVDIIASCARVPVRDGHLEAVVLKFREDVEVEKIKRKMESMKGLEGLPTAPAKPVIVRDEEDRPQPILDAYAGEGRARGMSVVTGRFAKFGEYIRFYLIVHNTIRGGAGASILNAEYALSNGYL